MKALYPILLLFFSGLVFAEPTAKVFDTSNNIGTISTGPAALHGIYINTTLSAHTVLIKNRTTAIFTIPASATAGNYYAFDETEFTTNLIVDPDDSSTGSITVIYEPLRP